MSVVYYGAHTVCPCHAFQLATVKMRGLLREDDLDSNWNSFADDEKQKLESATGVIFENEVETNNICEESGGSSHSVVNLSDLEGSDKLG